MNPEETPERIQKVLARAGVGSRRQIEAWIKEGRIKINGKHAVLGDHISSKDKIKGLIIELLIWIVPQQIQSRCSPITKPTGEILCTF